MKKVTILLFLLALASLLAAAKGHGGGLVSPRGFFSGG